MTIRLLRTLVAIADTKTFSAAAEVVNVTHAAVSQQMQTLEADLGVALFNRRTRTPELTPIAHQIVARSRRLIADYDNMVPSLLDDGGLSGTIKIGALGTTLTGLMPRALSVLKAHFPQLRLHIRPGLTGALLADIERGNLDAAIVTKPHLMPLGVQFRALTQELMQLITAMEEPEDDILMLLHHKPFIRFNRIAVVGTLIDNWILTNRVRVVEAMELDSLEAITSMVQANLGVSIVPDLTVKPYENVPVKRLSLGADAPTRIIGLAYPDDPVKTKAIDALYDALSSVIDEVPTNAQ